MLFQETVQKGNYLGPYVVLSKIQEGAQSIIYLARNKEKLYGLKVYKNGQKGRKFFEKQISILCCIDDQLIVKPYQTYAFEATCLDHQMNRLSQPFLVMQYYRKGDLRNFMNSGAIPVKVRNHLIKSMIKCLLALQIHGIIHGDIKPQNFLIDENYHLKLIDFGVAMRIGQQKQQLVGTLNYIAPQIHKSKNYSYKSDVFAVGVICFELVFSDKHTFPFKQAKVSDCNFLLLKQKMYDRFWSKFSPVQLQPQIKQFLQNILSVNPQQRPSSTQILELNCFQQSASYEECRIFFESIKPSSKMQYLLHCSTF